MERLLSLLSTTQSCLKKVGKHLDSPVLAVVGCQSSGKSSVLESMINLDVLPKKAGLCTRVPLELALIHDETQTTAIGEFKHLSASQNDRFKTSDQEANLKAIREEIWSRTNELTGPNEIKDLPIFLEVRSSKVTNLLLVDLPGVTKISVGSQSSNIVDTITQLVTRYITPKNTIILAVSPANMDLANSDSLQLARKVDPDGLRTVGVVTKVDIMDLGTDCLDILENRSYPLKLGYIAVKNRSQADLTSGLSLSASKAKEQEFFNSSSIYKHLAATSGSAYLTSNVSELLIEKVTENLPSLKEELMKNAENLRATIEETGGSVSSLGEADLQNYLSKICKEYCTAIVDSLEGNFSNDYKSPTHRTSNVQKQVEEKEKQQQRQISQNFNSRIDGNLKIKTKLLYHSRYFIHNNGSLSWYKKADNLQNPRTISMKDYDVEIDTESSTVFFLKSKDSEIHIKTSSVEELKNWVSMINKGRDFLKAAGQEVYTLNKISAVKDTNAKNVKKEHGKRKSVRDGLKGMSEHLLKGAGATSTSAGSVIRITFLTDFVPQMEKTNFAESFTSNKMALSNAAGYTFLNETLEIATVFQNSVSVIINGMKGLSVTYIEKVGDTIRKLITEAVPNSLSTYYALKQKIMGVAFELLKECLGNVLKEIDYEFELNSNFVNCQDEGFISRVPKEKPTLNEYIEAYIEQFKIHEVDNIWKLVMVLIIKRFKSDLMDKLIREIIYLRPEKIRALCEQDPTVVNKVRSMKNTLVELEGAINDLSMITI